jgi:hypothetical protein
MFNLRPIAKIAVDKRLDAAVENRLHVAALEIRTVVLDKLVWLEDIAANLVAPGDFAFVAVELGQLGVALLLLNHVKLTLEHFHRFGLVLVLAAVILAGRDNAGRDVRDADSGTGLVDVLASGASGTVIVDTEVVILDFNLDFVFVIGHDIDRGKAGMPPARRVKRADTDQPMDAGFTRQLSEGKRALDPKGDGTNAGFFTGSDVELLVFVAVVVEKTGVHAQEHVGPVAAFGAAGSGVNPEKARTHVVGAAEHPGDFDFIALFGKALQIVLDRSQGGFVTFLNGQIEQIAEVKNSLFDIKNGINGGFYGA